MLAVVVIGLAMGARGFSGPVDVEIAGVNLEEVKDLPLGGPEAGEGKAQGAGARRAAAPPRRRRRGDAGVARRQGRQDRAARPRPTTKPGPAPTSDLGAYGPEGSRLTVLMRLDRLRGTDYAAPVDELLVRLPDRRELRLRHRPRPVHGLRRAAGRDAQPAGSRR